MNSISEKIKALKTQIECERQMEDATNLYGKKIKKMRELHETELKELEKLG